MREKTARPLLAGFGALTIVAFFLPFVDVGGLVTASGWDVVTTDGIEWTTRIAFAALPLVGAGLIVAGLGRGTRARLLAFGFGAGVLGYLVVQTVRFFLATTGWGLWLTLVAAIGALVVAATMKRRG